MVQLLQNLKSNLSGNPIEGARVTFFWRKVNAFDVPSDERVVQVSMEPARTHISAFWPALAQRTRGWPDVITSRVVRAPRQGLSPSRREKSQWKLAAQEAAKSEDAPTSLASTQPQPLDESLPQR